MVNVRIIVAAVIAAAVLASGCGKKAEEAVQEKIVEQALKAGGTKDAKVDIKNGGVSIQGTNEKGEKIDIKTSGDKMTMTTSNTENGTTTISTEKNSFKSTSPDGTVVMSGEGATVPENFPKDIPIYAGTTVFSSSDSPKEATYMVQLQSNDAVKAVADYYAREMVAQGWKEIQKVENSGDSPMTMLSYEKEERTAMVNVMNDDGKSTIMISTAKK